MWVPLVENCETDNPGADYFVKLYLDKLFTQAPDIDTLILGCTHYPLLIDKIRQFVPDGVTVLPQGDIVADSLKDYLHRHPEIDSRITRGGTVRYISTEESAKFDAMAQVFMGQPVCSERATSLTQLL